MHDSTHPPAKLLLVDDEPNILASLNRLLRAEGYAIRTAESGTRALELLGEEAADVIVSDMRMPGMNGAEFLKHARERWPDSVRLLLTGFSDAESTISAVNEGGIHAYLTKPWDETHVLQAIRSAVERKRLVDERNALLALTARQNEELTFLNEGLEDAVRARTAELRQSATFLELGNKKLKENFHASLCVLSNLIELRQGNMSGHGKRVADLARKMAVRLNLREQEVNDITVAGLLHDIGKIGWTDVMFQKPFNVEFTVEERQLAMKHPGIAAKLLADLENMRNPALIIQHHHEHFNGRGYPDSLAGLDIPIGARILAVADDYDELQLGSITQRRRSPEQAALMIRDGARARYDPSVVGVFLKLMGMTVVETASGPERQIAAAELKNKHLLARNIIGMDGTMLLSKGYVLDEKLIQQLQAYEEKTGQSLEIWIAGA
ncbi:MAG: HD domain-containing phosphohydrolase [Gammaproteobacteria bacterium]